jgi:hypothetical protein
MTTPNVPSVLGQGSAGLPAHLQQYAVDAAEAAGLVTSFLSLPSISIKGKQFRFVKDGEETPFPAGQPFKAVILGMDPPKGCAKSFYVGAYTPGSVDAPDCFSSDGLTPDGFVATPVSRSCTECPHSVFGSGRDAAGQPTKGKLCGDHKNLFVVPFDQLDGDVAVLRVPATSLKALSAYGQELIKHGAPMQALVTEMTFTSDEHPQLAFRGESWLNAEDAARMITRGKSDELTSMKPSNNRGGTADAATPALPTGGAPALAAPAEYEATGAHSIQQLLDAGWSHEQMAAAGHAKLIEPEPTPKAPALTPPPTPEVAPTPPPVPEPAKPLMTAKANGVAYDEFIAQGWTDETLKIHGYIA